MKKVALTLAVAGVLVGSLNVCAVAAPRNLSTTTSSEATQAGDPVAHSTSLIDGVFCKLVTAGSVADAARRVIRHGTDKAWYGPLLADAVLATANYACPKIVKKAVKVVGEIFRSLRPSRSSSVRVYDLALPDLQAFTVGQMISIGGHPASANYILRAVNDLCADVRAGRNPVRSIGGWFPRADLRLIRAMNGVLSIAQRRCGLSTRFLVTLNSAMLQYMLANTYQADLSPPAAWLTNATYRRETNGRSTVTVYFAGSDQGGSGLRGFDVWINAGNGWQRLRCATTNACATSVYQGSRYQWAVQAIDRAGNRGAFVYSLVYAA